MSSPPSPQGTLNGYVRLPESVRKSGLSYSDGSLGEVRVHGGLTWGVDGDGWVGFDTGHSGDIWPIEVIQKWCPEDRIRRYGPIVEGGNNDPCSVCRKLRDEDVVYRDRWTIDWTIERLRAEVDKLADQIAAITCWHKPDSKAGTSECAWCALDARPAYGRFEAIVEEIGMPEIYREPAVQLPSMPGSVTPSMVREKVRELALSAHREAMLGLTSADSPRKADFYFSVLKAVADGICSDPTECIREALKLV